MTGFVAGQTCILRGGRRVDALAPDDRGLAYGDGVFETLLVHEGEPVWWDAHWRRLRHGAGRLGLPLPVEALIRDEGLRLAGGNSRAVLKIILTRGSGGRGYAAPARVEPTVLLSMHPAPAAIAAPVTLRWCATRLAVQPALAGIKHLNRLEQVLARAEWTGADIDEGLLCDSEGRVVSATAANLFVRSKGRWLTPPVDRCGVAGIAREWVLAEVAEAGEAELAPADVLAAEAVFLCNAVRGILPVGALDDRRWPAHDALANLCHRLAAAQPAFAFQEQ